MSEDISDNLTLYPDLPLGSTASHPSILPPASTTLKRKALSEDEGEGPSPKRLKEDMNHDLKDDMMDEPVSIDHDAFVNDLAQELQCGCCSELVYRPVVVNPCQHFFCGSCCVLWIRNSGTNCPACRGASSSVTPSRPLQIMIDVLLRHAPSRARTERERMQADEVYKAGHSMRIPTPREASPEPNLNQSSDYARPCPHCSPGNPFGWRCPQPIPDPSTDLDHAWHFDDGTPPGHAYCGNCENLLAIMAPTTTKCDLCQVSFCGIGVQGRCLAAPLLSQHPHGLSDISDLIQSSDIYECFESNTVEVEIMLDYITAQRLSPRHIYREIISHIQSQPKGFAPLIELEIFADVHGVAAGVDPNPEAPRNRICRLCATEVLLWGLREWWIRERRKGFLDESVMSRSDCPDGSGCSQQKDLAHAREFNHIIASREPEPEAPPPPLLEEPSAVSSMEIPSEGSSGSTSQYSQDSSHFIDSELVPNHSEHFSVAFLSEAPRPVPTSSSNVETSTQTDISKSGAVTPLSSEIFPETVIFMGQPQESVATSSSQGSHDPRAIPAIMF